MNENEVLHIVERIKSGDMNAYAILVDEYKDMVYSLCLKMTGSIEDAEEIAQDAFVKGFNGIKRFRGKSKFSTWLYQITYYTAVNFTRKQKLETSSLDELPESDSYESTFATLQRGEQQKYITAALDHLSPEETAIVTFYYLEGYTLNEVAEITSLSLSNVKVKIHRIRKKLYSIMHGLLKNELNSLV